jgi:hypothetical protein
VNAVQVSHREFQHPCGAKCISKTPAMQHALLRREPDGFGSSAHAGLDDQPPFSRLFLVCGKAADVSEGYHSRRCLWHHNALHSTLDSAVWGRHTDC